MNQFTANSINREWVKNVTLDEFKGAHKESGCSDEVLEDAYAQVKSIITPQEETIVEPIKTTEDGIGNGVATKVEEPTSKSNIGRKSNKQSKGDSASAKGTDEQGLI